MSRRGFLAAGLATTAGAAALAQAKPERRPEAAASVAATVGPADPARAPAPGSSGGDGPLGPFGFRRVLDLTHTLTPDFPTGSGQSQLTMERVSTRPKDPWNIYRWHIHEHTGTHIDAPLHRSNKDSADLIPASGLVGPLAVVDIRRKAAVDADAELTLDDLRAWESRNGPLPSGMTNSRRKVARWSGPNSSLTSRTVVVPSRRVPVTTARRLSGRGGIVPKSQCSV